MSMSNPKAKRCLIKDLNPDIDLGGKVNKEASWLHAELFFFLRNE